MGGLCDSAWLKWGWAVMHAQRLEDDINAFAAESAERQLYTVRTEYDAKCHCVRLSVTTVESLPARWGLRIGDIANNFRAALDHLTWVLVKRGTITLSDNE